MSERRCELCYWAILEPGDANTVMCWCFPPSVIWVDGEALTVFPSPYKDLECGQFKPKEAKAARSDDEEELRNMTLEEVLRDRELINKRYGGDSMRAKLIHFELERRKSI